MDWQTVPACVDALNDEAAEFAALMRLKGSQAYRRNHPLVPLHYDLAQHTDGVNKNR